MDSLTFYNFATLHAIKASKERIWWEHLDKEDLYSTEQIIEVLCHEEA